MRNKEAISIMKSEIRSPKNLMEVWFKITADLNFGDRAEELTDSAMFCMDHAVRHGKSNMMKVGFHVNRENG